MDEEPQRDADGTTELDPPDPAQRFGAAAAADAELADEVLEDADGDADAAASRFDAESRGPVGTEKGAADDT